MMLEFPNPDAETKDVLGLNHDSATKMVREQASHAHDTAESINRNIIMRSDIIASATVFKTRDHYDQAIALMEGVRDDFDDDEPEYQVCQWHIQALLVLRELLYPEGEAG
jgi:hypothetical protein